jgi:hypothetical protein
MQIRTDRLFDCYKNADCRRVIARFLADEGKWKTTEILWKEFNLRFRDKKVRRKKSASNKVVIEEMLLTAYESYYFEGTTDGVFLRENVTIDYKIPNHKTYFEFFFPYLLQQCPDRLKFLEFHLNNSFDGNTTNYKLFLKLIDKSVLSETVNAFLDEWTVSYLVASQKQVSKLEKEQGRPTTKQLAAAYYFQVVTGLELWDDGGKMKHLNAVAKKYEVSPKDFYNHFTKISKTSIIAERDKEKVRELLKDIPAALAKFESHNR